MQKSYKISVPGSLMLFGEHAVLHGRQAIVCAIDKRITISLTPRSDRQIIINSALGDFKTDLDNIEIKRPFEFVLTAIKFYCSHYPYKFASGFELEIQSEFSHAIGFGSSAAVTVATLAVLYLWIFDELLDLKQLLVEGVVIVNKVQGVASGADVAASVLGGIVAYRNSPLTTEKLSGSIPITAIYSGSKMPTAEVIAHVENLRLEHMEIFRFLFNAIDCCAEDAMETIKNQDLKSLGELMNINAGLQDAMGVSNAVLGEIIYQLRQQPTIYGAKISGSGLGDCVVGLGSCDKNLGYQQIAVEISENGILVF